MTEQQKAMEFKKGDLIVWVYTHAIGKSRFTRYKKGVFKRYNGNDRNYAFVHLYGNKGFSKVWINSLFKH